jgi:HECT-like Ubiquitin-conjugating enzyme (E2)-binding
LQQATIDFTTASTNEAQVGAVLVDTNAIILHQNDVGPALCVLAVDGYGEELALQPSHEEGSYASPFAKVADELGNDSPATLRGPRAWRDAVGGGTICCSQCCAVLGFASVTSPDTFRLLKHRLILLDQVSDSVQSVMSCASFVAHEMIRYADTKAIFTFVLERNERRTSHNQGKQRRLLMLKLLSWDCQFASSHGVTKSDSGVSAANNPQFQKAAKLIWEEAWVDVDRQVEGEDLTNWTWGGADICCLPRAAQSTAASGGSAEKEDQGAVLEESSSSSVTLPLDEDEWDDVLVSLRTGEGIFSDDVVRATVFAKLGRSSIPAGQRGSGSSASGLSLIPL